MQYVFTQKLKRRLAIAIRLIK